MRTRTVFCLLALIAAVAPAARAIGPDLWAATPLAVPGVRDAHSAIYDPVRNRMVVFGGNSGSAPLNDTWAFDLTTHTWKQLATVGTPPAARYKHVAIYDAPRDRMVIFGGFTGTTLFNDTWALNLNTLAWTQLSTTGTTPSKRARHAGIFNPANNTLVIFGGYNGSAIFNDLYTLNLVTNVWTKITAGGTLPEARQGHSAIYDPGLGRMIVFGGSGAVTQLLNDTWALTLATNTWVNLNPSGSLPPARFNHGVIYDSARGRMVIYGGQTSLTVFRGDTWALSLSGNSWTQLSSGGGPSARTRMGVIYDTTHDNMTMFGGATSGGSTNDSWTFAMTGNAWAQVPGVGTVPSARLDMCTAYVSTQDRTITFGGWLGSPGTELNDTYALTPTANGLTWSRLTTFNTPLARFGHTAIYDPVTNQYLVYGGGNGPNWLADLWSLNPTTLVWTQLNPPLPHPPADLGYSMVFDPAHRRFIIFGGQTTGRVYIDDCWAYNIDANTWTKITAPGPAARGGNAAISDDAHNRMVIWSGADSQTHFFTDTWALNYATDTWQQLTTTNTPPGRGSVVSVWDSQNDRMICFGGTAPQLFNDTPELDLTTLVWTEPAFAAGTAPSPRASTAMTWDPVRHWAITWGGNEPSPTATGGILYNTANAATDMDPDQPSSGRPSRRGGGVRKEITAIGSQAAARLSLSARRTPGGVAFSLALPEDTYVRLDILTVDGRRVARVVDGPLDSGEHLLGWNGVDDAGHPAARGVYLARIVAGSEGATTKVTLF
jgi:N-acetylneuraminic acid mutarotase